MKRILYSGSLAALVASFAFAGGRSYAAHQASPSSAAMMQVRLCTSTPFGVPALAHLSHGIENGAKLATMQMKAAFAKAHLKLLPPLTLDYAKSDGSGYSTDAARSNALACLADRTVYGMVGTLNSGAALVAEPILNKGHMVMISPANTGTVLTNPASRKDQEPATYNHQIPYVTYYRVVTTDALQGPADAIYMHNVLHVNKYFLMDDKQTYGAGLAASFDLYAKKLGMTKVGIGHIDPSDSSSIATSTDAVTDQIVAKNPDGVFYGGDSETAITLPKRLRGKGFTKPLVGGDALQNAAYIKNAGSRGSLNDYCSSIGPAPQQSGSGFRAAYAKAFHTPLDSYDATSYDAAKIELKAILQAKAAGKLAKGGLPQRRLAVVRFVSSTSYFGATGHTTFDRNGDTTNRIITIYKVGGVDWLPVGRAPKIPGVSPTG
ncbi:MAG: branched-chain amino acid ABC transporter substrate-binding protein [Chloroflexota bacterium]